MLVLLEVVVDVLDAVELEVLVELDVVVDLINSMRPSDCQRRFLHFLRQWQGQYSHAATTTYFLLQPIYYGSTISNS